jgi:hypothetical protein
VPLQIRTARELRLTALVLIMFSEIDGQVDGLLVYAQDATTLWLNGEMPSNSMLSSNPGCGYSFCSSPVR